MRHLPAVFTAILVALVAAGCRSTDTAANTETPMAAGPALVTALGRIEPKDGIRPRRRAVAALGRDRDAPRRGRATGSQRGPAARRARLAGGRRGGGGEGTGGARATPRSRSAASARSMAQRIVSQEALDTAQLHVDTARADLVGCAGRARSGRRSGPPSPGRSCRSSPAPARTRRAQRVRRDRAERRDVRRRRGLRDGHRPRADGAARDRHERGASTARSTASSIASA